MSSVKTIGLFHPLQNRLYRKLLAAQIIALIGTGLTSVALALLAYEMAAEDAGFVLGTVFALKMIAYVCIAPFVGGIAHRLPRRSLLIALDVLRAVLVCCLPWIEAIWQIYILIFLLNSASAAFTPLFQACIPDILKDEKDYTQALSLSRLAYDIEALSSPVLAILLLGFMAFDSLFLLNGIAFLLSASLLISLTLPKAAMSERSRRLGENLLFGVRSYFKTPRLRALFALGWSVAAASSMILVNTVIFVQDRFGLGESDTALMYGAAGAGSMVTALLLPKVLGEDRDRLFMIGGAMLLTCSLVFGGALFLVLPPGNAVLGFWSLMPLWFCLGVGLATTQTPAGRLVRRSAKAADRSAYFAAQFALSHFCWLVCYPLAGWLGTQEAQSLLDLGEVAFFGMAFVAGLGLCGALRLWPKHDHLVLPHEHKALSHDHPHYHDAHHDHDHEGWEGPEPHVHPHRHAAIRHQHDFVIDSHHPEWPR